MVTAQLNVKDHPLVSRSPGSTVLEYNSKEFDALAFPLGKMTDTDRYTNAKSYRRKSNQVQVPRTEGSVLFGDKEKAFEAAGPIRSSPRW
jgi:hypothetical protein